MVSESSLYNLRNFINLGIMSKTEPNPLFAWLARIGVDNQVFELSEIGCFSNKCQTFVGKGELTIDIHQSLLIRQFQVGREFSFFPLSALTITEIGGHPGYHSRKNKIAWFGLTSSAERALCIHASQFLFDYSG